MLSTTTVKAFYFVLMYYCGNSDFYWDRNFMTPIESLPFHEIICFRNVEVLQSVSFWIIVALFLQKSFIC